MILIIILSVLSVAYTEIRKDIINHPNWYLVEELQDDCGENVADRIIGGVNATLGQYPWLARLGYSYELDPNNLTVDNYECGGAIINERYVVSAAHCGPKEVGLKMLQLRLGEWYTETDPDCSNGMCAPPVQDIDVEATICHPKYNKRNFHYDLCLIRLAKPIEFNNFVQPICLPVYEEFINDPKEKTIMEVAGWGIYDIATGQPHTILQTVKVPMVNINKCKKKYADKAPIVNTQFCAGGVIGKDSCSGDSGGPIMRPFSFNAPPKYFIVGVVSFGPTKCGATDAPGVYSKISAFLPWILDNMKP